MRTDIISRETIDNIEILDKGVKNHWRWEWLEKEVEGVFLRETLRKLKAAGTAYCVLCQRELTYGSRGLVALVDHVKSSKHRRILETKKTNFALPGTGSCNSEELNNPYGLHPMFSKVAVALPRLPEPLTPFSDRCINSEAMLVAFLAEKSLSFSLAPDILDLAKALAQDQKVLGQMTMHRTAVSYKLRYGVAKTFQEKLLDDLKKNFFSLNIDESMSSNFQKMVTILVNIPNDNGQILTKHLSSFSVVRGDSASLFNGIIKIFEENNIPWDNLMSVLLDSCNVMRGKKAGLETKLRMKCPHLLDIGGDTCHHTHNAAKMFCRPFEMYLETLFTDIHNDLKWSPDLRAALIEICEAVNIKYTMPQSFISFRWLSVYDCTMDLHHMFAPLTLFYFSFLSKDDKREFLHIIVKIYRGLNISDTATDVIRGLQTTLATKNMTKQGKNRKDRITQKLFHSQVRTKLIMGIFSAVLPLLKEYILMFEAASPLIHTLYEKQWDLLKNFLTCFIKPEVLQLIGRSSKKVKDLKIEKSSNHLPICSIFMGDMAKKLIKLAPKSQLEIIKEFQSSTLKAFVGCAKKMIAKMPFSNPFLKAVSTLDPFCRNHSVSLKLMKDLPSYASNVISSAEKELYDLEVHHFQSDNFRPIGDKESIDMWWKHVEITSKYPLLSRLAFALLTCFHGPKVESSFSLMHNIITQGSSRLNVSTFDAIQSVKYELLSQKKSSVSMFAKKDFLKEKVDPKLCRNFRNARKLYRDEHIQNRFIREQRKKQLDTNKEKFLTKKAAKKQRIDHKKSLKEDLKKSKTDVNVSKDTEVQLSLRRQLEPNLNENSEDKPKRIKTQKKSKNVLTIKEMFMRSSHK